MGGAMLPCIECITGWVRTSPPPPKCRGSPPWTVKACESFSSLDGFRKQTSPQHARRHVVGMKVRRRNPLTVLDLTAPPHMLQMSKSQSESHRKADAHALLWITAHACTHAHTHARACHMRVRTRVRACMARVHSRTHARSLAQTL